MLARISPPTLLCVCSHPEVAAFQRCCVDERVIYYLVCEVLLGLLGGKTLYECKLLIILITTYLAPQQIALLSYIEKCFPPFTWLVWVAFIQYKQMGGNKMKQRNR